MNLQRTQLRKISDRAFANLNSVEKIELSDNPLKVAPVLPPSLNSLDFSNVQIVNLTKHFLAELPYVQVANFQNGIIEFIEDTTFIAQGQLTVLNLTGNNINVITSHALAMGDYVYNTDTEALELPLNEGISKRSVNAMSQLLHLDLSHNQIIEIKRDAFSTHSKLLSLRLDRNNIIEVTDLTFLGLPKLEILRLENNNLKFLAPRAFRHLSTLEVNDE